MAFSCGGFLNRARADGKSVAAYGAAAKGNTLLNFCGVGGDLIDYVVDASPHKQGRYMPGSRLAIYRPEKLAETRPDYVLILPWNLRHEITARMAVVRDWGGRFVVPIPTTVVLPSSWSQGCAPTRSCAACSAARSRESRSRSP